MPPQRSASRIHLPLGQRSLDFFPHSLIRLDKWACLNIPVKELYRCFSRDKASGPHLLGPQTIVRRDNELCFWKMRFQQLAKFVAMRRIHGHDHIIQEREAEFLSEKPF